KKKREKKKKKKKKKNSVLGGNVENLKKKKKKKKNDWYALYLREQSLQNEAEATTKNGTEKQEIEEEEEEEDGDEEEEEDDDDEETTKVEVKEDTLKKMTNEEAIAKMWRDSEIDKKQCVYLLEELLPKAIITLLSFDFSRCDYNDIANYQRLMLSQQAVRTNPDEDEDMNDMETMSFIHSSPIELREILVQQIITFLQFAVESMFQVGMDRFPKYCEVLGAIYNPANKLYKPNFSFYSRLPPSEKERLIRATSGHWAINSDYHFEKLHHLYFQTVNHFGDIHGFSLLLQFMKNEIPSSQHA
ncbi:hypothetical protein RFI_31703, partial [Reticulomyxa filosa]